MNELFKKISETSNDFDRTFLFIDEVLVVTREGDDLLGNAPFLCNGQPADWSRLDPLGINTVIAVTPDSECYLNPRIYTAQEIEDNNRRAVIPTHVLSRTYRSNKRIYGFIKFIQQKLEEAGLLGFNLKTTDVCYGHEIVGERPQWSAQESTDHMRCFKGCERCFLNESVLNVLKSLEPLDLYD